MAAEKQPVGEPAKNGGVDKFDSLLVNIGKHIKEIQEILTSARKTKAVTSRKAGQLKSLQKLSEALGRLVSLQDSTRHLEQHCAEQAERDFLELEENFRDFCNKNGWRLEGEWPSLFVERGIAVEIEVDQRNAVVAGKKVEATVEAIVATLEPLVPHLLPKEFSTRQFIDELAAAYDGVRGDAAQVQIFDVYRAMILRSQPRRFWRDARSEKFVPLSADQFRARIARTLEESETRATDGRVLRILPPLDARDGLFVYQHAESRFGYVGRIEFALTERSVSS